MTSEPKLLTDTQGTQANTVPQCSPLPSALQFIQQSDDLTSTSTAQWVPQCYCSSQGVDLLHGNAQLFNAVHSLERQGTVHGDALTSASSQLFCNRGLERRLVISSVCKEGQQNILDSSRGFKRFVLRMNLAPSMFVITQNPHQFCQLLLKALSSWYSEARPQLDHVSWWKGVALCHQPKHMQ